MKRRALLSLLGMSPALLATTPTLEGQTTSPAAKNAKASSPIGVGIPSAPLVTKAFKDFAILNAANQRLLPRPVT